MATNVIIYLAEAIALLIALIIGISIGIKHKKTRQKNKINKFTCMHYNILFYILV